MDSFGDFMIDEAVKKDRERLAMSSYIRHLETALREIESGEHAENCRSRDLLAPKTTDCDCFISIARMALAAKMTSIN